MNARFSMQATAVNYARPTSVVNCDANVLARRATTRSTTVVRVTRERVFGCLALLALIFAWDATLRMDEQAVPANVLTVED
jgi:hypothetical protein